MLPAPLQALQAHQGEELILILPAVILLGTWLIATWPVKARTSKDSKDEPKRDGQNNGVTGGSS